MVCSNSHLIVSSPRHTWSTWIPKLNNIHLDDHLRQFDISRGSQTRKQNYIIILSDNQFSSHVLQTEINNHSWSWICVCSYFRYNSGDWENQIIFVFAICTVSLTWARMEMNHVFIVFWVHLCLKWIVLGVFRNQMQISNKTWWVTQFCRFDTFQYQKGVFSISSALS